MITSRHRCTSTIIIFFLHLSKAIQIEREKTWWWFVWCWLALHSLSTQCTINLCCISLYLIFDDCVYGFFLCFIFVPCRTEFNDYRYCCFRSPSYVFFVQVFSLEKKQRRRRCRRHQHGDRNSKMCYEHAHSICSLPMSVCLFDAPNAFFIYLRNSIEFRSSYLFVRN